MSLRHRLPGTIGAINYLHGTSSPASQACKYCKVNLQTQHHKRHCFTRLSDLPTKRTLDMHKMESAWLMGFNGDEMPQGIQPEEGCYYLDGEECRNEPIDDPAIPDAASATLGPIHTH